MRKHVRGPATQDSQLLTIFPFTQLHSPLGYLSLAKWEKLVGFSPRPRSALPLQVLARGPGKLGAGLGSSSLCVLCPSLLLPYAAVDSGFLSQVCLDDL